MKKALFTVAALAAATTLVAPKFIGDKVKDRFQDLVYSINQLPYYQAQLIKTQSSWFGHKGTLQLTLDMAAMLADGAPANYAPLVLDIDYTTQHGPIVSSGLALAQFQLSIRGDSIRDILVWPNETPFYRVDGKLDLTGALSYEDHIPALTFQDGQDTMMIDPYSGKAWQADDEIRYQAQLPLIRFDSENARGEVNQIRIDASMPHNLFEHLQHMGWYDSDVRMAVDNISFNQADAESVLLKALSLNMLSRVDPDTRLADMNVSYKLQHLAVGEFEGNNMELSLEMNNLDEAAFVEINKLMADQSASTQTDAYLATFNQNLKKHLLTLFQQQPEFNISALKGSFPQGTVDAKLKSKLVDVTKIPEDLEDPAFWMTHIQADSQIQIAKELARLVGQNQMRNQFSQNPNFLAMDPAQQEQVLNQQVTNFFTMLETQGMLKSEGNDYLVDAKFAHGKGTINGQPMPFGQP